jgi:hypothetical protein
MNKKKQILKKCCNGKDGIVGDTIKEIPGTLKEMGKNIKKGLNPGNISISRGIKNGINWVGGQIKKDNESRAFEGQKMGEAVKLEKKENILRSAINKKQYKAPKSSPKQQYKIPDAMKVDSSKVGM